MSGRLLTPRQTADMLNVTVSVLQKWRNAGIGPDYVKLGDLKPGARRDLRHVRYQLDDVEAYISTHKQSRKENPRKPS